MCSFLRGPVKEETPLTNEEDARQIVQCAENLGLLKEGSKEESLKKVVNRGVGRSVVRRNIKDVFITVCFKYFVPARNKVRNVVTGDEKDLLKAQTGFGCSYCIKNDEMFHVLNVYGHLCSRNKRILWEEMRGILNIVLGEALCVMGYFNCVRGPGERMNCEYRNAESSFFNKFIEDINLMDLEILNSSYTWFGVDEKKSKLDRVLPNSQWFSIGAWMIKAMNMKLSDHKPLVLFINKINWGPKPFKVFNWGLQDPSLANIMENFWRQEMNNVKEDVKETLQKVKKVLKVWSSNAKDNLLQGIKALENKVDDLDLKDTNGEEVKTYRLLLEDHKLIKAAFYSHFFEIYHNGLKCDFLNLDKLVVEKLNESERSWLEMDIREERVDLPLKEDVNDKSPGPRSILDKTFKGLGVGTIKGIALSYYSDITGDLVSMLRGSLCFEDRRINELHAFMEGLKEVFFYRNYRYIILETDHVEAYWEWRHSSQRCTDKNYKAEVRLADPEDNALVAYVAHGGWVNPQLEEGQDNNEAMVEEAPGLEELVATTAM
ncbi:hypothetical protein POM88_040703 [Heracleum sosnowskyi]|uniref:Reverse transcriptase n=1 Tax=Heracleum sosnowskyi TaxID=360622 RepID=A0AAD8HFE9_9APIA|nr:hypothetical protein POM88_040703 [Heracleum sosnowskyi]